LVGTLTDIVQRIMQKSKVVSGTKVAIVSAHTYDRDYLHAFTEAATNLGANAVRVVAPPAEKKGRLVSAGLINPYLREVMKKSEIIFDIVTPGVPWVIPLYTPEFDEILASKTRVLSFMVTNPEANLRRLFPTKGLYERTWAGAKRMAKAKKIKITSKFGTNLTLSKEGRKGHKQVGVSDYPGMWDNYGFGLVACAPTEESAEGTFVIAPGDYILGVGIDCMDPIRIKFKKGVIEDVTGDGWSATLLRRWIEGHDEGVKRISHIGWGTHESAVWRDDTTWSGPADAESVYGLMQLALGINLFDTPHQNSGLGGKNKANGHCDIDCLHHDFYLDDELICKDGTIVHPDFK